MLRQQLWLVAAGSRFPAGYSRSRLGAGKKLLKERYGLTTYIDIEASIGEVLYRALEQVRYIYSEQWDSNITRAKLHPLWEKATSEIPHSLGGSHNPLVENLVKDAIRREKIDTYTKQMFGSARGLAVSLGMTNDQIRAQLPRMIGDKLGAHLQRDGERLFKAVEKTRKKLRFVA